MRLIPLAIAAFAMTATPAFAAPCRDAKGKFVKCTAVKKVVKKTQCRDAKGHFKKC